MPAISSSPMAAARLPFPLIALVALTAIRLIGLRYSAVDLYFDEAQYWAWSRDLAFGYFSKPPLLAWIIAASDVVCGSTEACVRSASPVFYLGTCLVIYAIGRELYDRETGCWAALAFALGIGLTFSSRIISTDVPLLFFWAVALLAYVKLLRAPGWQWTVVLGAAIGFGMLAKYAMIYFVLGAVCAAFSDPGARAFFKHRQAWIAFAMAALILSPNVYWNFANGFVTLKHTGDNISGDGPSFSPLGPVRFLGSQFAVAGPFVFGGFLVILMRSIRERLRREDWLMLAFAIPPLALVTTLSFVRNANENWAAPSILSMTILAVGWWVRNNERGWLWATFTLGLILQAGILAGDAFAYRITLPAMGRNADVYHVTLGWRPLGDETRNRARAAGAKTVAVEGRAEAAALLYYLRNDPFKIASWPANTGVESQFDMTNRLDASATEPLLLITPCPSADRIKRSYGDVMPLGQLTAKSGPTSARLYYTFKLAGHKNTIEPLGGCPDPTQKYITIKSD